MSQKNKIVFTLKEASSLMYVELGNNNNNIYIFRISIWFYDSQYDVLFCQPTSIVTSNLFEPLINLIPQIYGFATVIQGMGYFVYLITDTTQVSLRFFVDIQVPIKYSFYVNEYSKMLEENLDDYIENFDSYMQPSEKNA